jgi:hypothetical protein
VRRISSRPDITTRTQAATLKFFALLVLLSVCLHAQAQAGPRAPSIEWLGDASSVADRQAFTRLQAEPRLAPIFRYCAGHPITIWKVRQTSKDVGYFVFCDEQAFALDKRGGTFAGYIPIGRGLQCRSPENTPCPVSVQELPSIRVGATDFLVRTRHGCAELSWRGNGDEMHSTAVECRQPVGALVAEKANCARVGGSWETTGRLAVGVCVTAATDGGRACKRDWECQNACSAGFCAATTKSPACREFPSASGGVATACE